MKWIITMGQFSNLIPDAIYMVFPCCATLFLWHELLVYSFLPNTTKYQLFETHISLSLRRGAPYKT